MDTRAADVAASGVSHRDTQAVLPPRAWDCHAHVFGPAARFPLAAERSYTPAEALPDELQALHAQMGVEHVVLVQPSPYGNDNSCMLHALDTIGPSARGVAALHPDDVTDARIRTWSRRGVRGLRLNPNGLITRLNDELADELRKLARRLEGTGWHIDINIAAGALSDLAATLEGTLVPVVLDHLAHVSPAHAQADANVDHVLRLVERGGFWVKVSGIERLASTEAELAWLGRTLLKVASVNPERMIWGSDWPHTPFHGGRDPRQVQPFRTVRTSSLLHTALEWLPGTELRHRLFSSNPTTLYG